MTKASINPQRGEIWDIVFDPSHGEEIRKTRPAVVVNEPIFGRKGLRIVVPILTCDRRSDRFPWFLKLRKNRENGLSFDSESDSSQVKSLSVKRFVKKRGQVTTEQLKKIVDGIALCIGYEQ